MRCVSPLCRLCPAARWRCRRPEGLATIQDLGRPGYQHAGGSRVRRHGPLRTARRQYQRGTSRPTQVEADACRRGIPFLGRRRHCLDGRRPARPHTPDLPNWDIPPGRHATCDQVPGSSSGGRCGAPGPTCRSPAAYRGGAGHGSRANLPAGRLWGLRRAGVTGGRLPVGPARGDVHADRPRAREAAAPPPYAPNPTVRIVLGPHADRFADDSVSALLTESYARVRNRTAWGW